MEDFDLIIEDGRVYVRLEKSLLGKVVEATVEVTGDVKGKTIEVEKILIDEDGKIYAKLKGSADHPELSDKPSDESVGETDGMVWKGRYGYVIEEDKVRMYYRNKDGRLACLGEVSKSELAPIIEEMPEVADINDFEELLKEHGLKLHHTAVLALTKILPELYEGIDVSVEPAGRGRRTVIRKLHYFHENITHGQERGVDSDGDDVDGDN